MFHILLYPAVHIVLLQLFFTICGKALDQETPLLTKRYSVCFQMSVPECWKAANTRLVFKKDLSVGGVI